MGFSKRALGLPVCRGGGVVNFEDRYAPNWPETSRLARSLTNHQCVLCDRPATETHHALYADTEGEIHGREIPGVHVFPLCCECHQGDGGAHDVANWHSQLNDQARGNHQRPEFYKRLRSGWLLKAHQLDLSRQQR